MFSNTFIRLGVKLTKDYVECSLMQILEILKVVADFIKLYNLFIIEDSTITFGARSDSFYEYLFKQWIQTGKTIDWLKEDYGKAMKAMEKYLYRNSKPNKMFFIGELLSGQTYSPKMVL